MHTRWRDQAPLSPLPEAGGRAGCPGSSLTTSIPSCPAQTELGCLVPKMSPTAPAPPWEGHNEAFPELPASASSLSPTLPSRLDYRCKINSEKKGLNLKSEAVTGSGGKPGLPGSRAGAVLLGSTAGEGRHPGDELLAPITLPSWSGWSKP